jgi:hypothetical protein
VEGSAPEVALAVDFVAVAPSDLGSLEVSLGDQLGDDPLGRSFGDSYLLGDVAGAGVFVSRDAEQHVRVVAEEDPGWLVRGRLCYRNLLSRLA